MPEQVDAPLEFEGGFRGADDKVREVADGIEDGGDEKGNEKKAGVEGCGVAVKPADRGLRYRCPNRGKFAKESSADSQESAGQDIAGIVIAEINARDADDEENVDVGEDAEAAGDEEQRGGQRKEQCSMIAGKRTPVNEGVLVNAVREYKVN